jgi:hypothetical protein
MHGVDLRYTTLLRFKRLKRNKRVDRTSTPHLDTASLTSWPRTLLSKSPPYLSPRSPKLSPRSHTPPPASPKPSTVEALPSPSPSVCPRSPKPTLTRTGHHLVRHQRAEDEERECEAQHGGSDTAERGAHGAPHQLRERLRLVVVRPSHLPRETPQ